MRKITGFMGAALLLTVSVCSADSLCFEEAGDQYGINPRILRAIAKVESNYESRAINWNTNGTYDFGVMQINSLWAAVLGTEHWNSLGDSCANIKTGAMILSGCMKKYGYTWEAVGCYNSRTPDKRDRYAEMIFKQLQRIEHQPTQTVQKGVRDQVAEVVPAEAAGPDEEHLVHSADANFVVPALDQPPIPHSHSPELRASSQFEVNPGGL